MKGIDLKMTAKKWCNQAISFFLVCSLFLPSPVKAAVPDTVQPRASSYFQFYEIYTYAAGNGKIQVWYDIYGHHRMNEIGVLRIVLQESSDQVSWTNVATYFYVEYYDEMMSETAVTHFGHVDYDDGIVGKYYRARVTLYASDDAGYETPFYLTETELCT